MRIFLKGKIGGVKVDYVDSSCSGSIGIDSALMEAADILEYEQVHVLNERNGARFITYAIKEDTEEHEGGVCIYGPAAKLVEIGDSLIILSYEISDDNEIREVKSVEYEDENDNSDQGG